MTEQHPITPPPELVQQWTHEWNTLGARHPAATNTASYVAALAAQWGADQELEACCEWLEDVSCDDPQDTAKTLRAARRPKPPSLKQQALEAMREMQIEPCIINGVNTNAGLQAKYDILLRALEQLPDS